MSDQISLNTRARGSFAAVDDAVTVLDAFGSTSTGLQIVATVAFTATLLFEASLDGTNFFSVLGTPYAGGAAVTQATAAGNWILYAPGAVKVRVRCSAYTSGTPTATLQGGLGAGAVTFGSSGAATVDTELPAAALPADDTPNAAVPRVWALAAVWDAATSQWEPARASADRYPIVAVQSTATPTDAMPNTESSGQFGPNGASRAVTNAQLLFVGNVGGTAVWDRERTPNIFKTFSLAQDTVETTIWDPAPGKKFRVMGLIATCEAAAELTFKDNTAGSTIFVARASGDTPISPSGMGNGILSATVDNVLTVTRSASVALRGTVWGTEE